MVTPQSGKGWPIASGSSVAGACGARGPLTGDCPSCERVAVATGVVDAAALGSKDIVRLAPFIEQMGPMTHGGRKEFWWEREWRHRGHFDFGLSDVVAVFAPETDHRALRRDLGVQSSYWKDRPVPMLDPIWGQERMIAAMSGVDPDQIGPFPA